MILTKNSYNKNGKPWKSSRILRVNNTCPMWRKPQGLTTTGVGAWITAGAGAVCSTTDEEAWNTAGEGAICSTTGSGDEITAGTGEMYSNTGAGAPRRFTERTMKN